MRRAIGIACLIALTSATAARGETWVKYIDLPKGLAWSYESDYTYTDQASGRLVVMQAISKAESNIGPSTPGKPDGVGSVVALDCKKKTLVTMSAYSPKSPLAIDDKWREAKPNKAGSNEDKALLAAVCPTAAAAPVR